MRYIFLLFFVLVSCESQNNIHEQNVNLLNEVITLTMLLGCLLIITGVGLINFFQKESN